MRRLALPLVGALVLIAAGLTAHAAGDKKVTFKFTVPDEEAKITIDGKSTDGAGLKREVEFKVPQGKEAVLITVLWEPNNYTKIWRTYHVTPKEGEVVVNMRKPNPKVKDHIEDPRMRDFQ